MTENTAQRATLATAFKPQYFFIMDILLLTMKYISRPVS